jgi:2-amino-4-hydroxy-6-hydroxymethyldihydropteridine diphosphokinase
VLLEHLLRIERERGRNRSVEVRLGPRTLDLDLLLYSDWCINEPGLHVPHPRMCERQFVMQPLAQIAPRAAAALRAKALH